MRRWWAISKPALMVLAAFFAAAATLYSCLWMYAVRHQGFRVEFGFESNFSDANHWLDVNLIMPNSPAERAGLLVRDKVVAIDGQRLQNMDVFNRIWWRARPGDSVQLTIDRPGVRGPQILHGIFRKPVGAASKESLARSSALQITGSFPIVFLVVGLAVLFLRVGDPNAWLLALLFGGFIAVPGLQDFAVLSPGLQEFAQAYRGAFLGMFGALFYLFFAIFPAKSPLERAAPWLKWAGLALGAGLGMVSLRAGDVSAPRFLARMLGDQVAERMVLSYIYGFVVLGLISLAGNTLYAPSAEARRKVRCILYGTLAGVLPIAVEHAAMDFTGYRPPFWLDELLILNLFFFPLSFAYAVVKHRVLEIPVLLKRSARYLLVRRGFTVLIFLLVVSAIAIFTETFTRFFRVDVNVAMPIGVGFGLFLAMISARPLRRATERIDRSFFRGSYDARKIMDRLAENVRTANRRDDISLLLAGEISEALHPIFVSVYFENGNGGFEAQTGEGNPPPAPVSACLRFLEELAERGRPMEMAESPDGSEAGRRLAVNGTPPECLAPIPGRDGRMLGIIALGPRLSEEPYSGDDRRLLSSVANQAGSAVENIGMAEKIAERMEVERRAGHEMEIARQVQARLFPQKFPPLQTLVYTGKCTQTRQVGGDYYDFLDLGRGRLGIVLADIAGKGISGALLMANLQANLRGQYALALDNLAGLLESVNRLFFENTTEEAYATLFFGEYDDATRKLRYANCGHLAALVLHPNGEMERLESTSTVLGLFQEWTCNISELRFERGDTMLLYSDGVTEASNAQGQDFGAQRLVEALRRRGSFSVEAAVDAIIEDVLKFSEGVQADDITLVLARCR